MTVIDDDDVTALFEQIALQDQLCVQTLAVEAATVTCSFASPDSGRFLAGDNAELIERFVCETCNQRENTPLNAGSPSRGPLQLRDSSLEPEVHEAGA